MAPRLTTLLVILNSLFGSASAELVVPAFTAYAEPDGGSIEISSERGISRWKDKGEHALWFGEIKKPGKLTARLQIQGDEGRRYRLTIDATPHEAIAQGGVLDFGDYEIQQPGYVRLELAALSDADGRGQIGALVLSGPASVDAHFNLLPRRNAASVHLKYLTPEGAEIAVFYSEVTAVEDPVATYYMACGFSRGYFGMQVNSATERRLIFSVWDAGSGQSAKDRSNVAADDQTQLLAKGEGVEAHVFGNEGTGGHSHFSYSWKTGEAQKFFVTAKADGSHTIYSGYWYHPEQKAWMLMASFRAPKDGKLLRGLYSFSENFGGSNGQLRRKALFGSQWIADVAGRWTELTQAKFSHDATGKTDRLDRFMGVERGQFFLSHGGFIAGTTPYGEAFTRPATGKPPVIQWPKSQ